MNEQYLKYLYLNNQGQQGNITPGMPFNPFSNPYEPPEKEAYFPTNPNTFPYFDLSSRVSMETKAQFPDSVFQSKRLNFIDSLPMVQGTTNVDVPQTNPLTITGQIQPQNTPNPPFYLDKNSGKNYTYNGMVELSKIGENILGEENNVNVSNTSEQEAEGEQGAEGEKKKIDYAAYANMFNVGLADINLNSSLFSLGKSLGFDSSNYENQKRAKTSNTARGIASAGKSLLNMGRLVGAGMGYQNRYDNWNNNNRKDVRESSAGTNLYTPYKEGGLVQFLKNGGTIEGIPIPKMLTGEYITGLPKSRQHEGNAEVEAGEYVKHANQDVHQVIGKKHSQGGEIVSLEVGTTVVSDDLKVGQDFVTRFKKQFKTLDLKITAKDTYASVIEKYTKKIGLTTLNEVQEKQFNTLEKQDSVEDMATKEINSLHLAKNINQIEGDKNELEKQRSLFYDFIFQEQELSKPQVDTNAPIEQFKQGGFVKNKYFRDLREKHNLTEEQAIDIITRVQNGELTNLAEGGNPPPKMPLREGQTYNSAAIPYILPNQSPEPTYNYGDLEGMRERIKLFKDSYGVTEITNEQIDSMSQPQLDALAGQLQSQVTTRFPNIAEHYGKNVVSTKEGLQYLVSSGGLKEKDSNIYNKIVDKKGNVKRGAYDTLSKTEKEQIGTLVKSLPNDQQTQYAVDNFQDSQWYFRYPGLETVYYNDKEEYSTIQDKYQDLGNGVYYSGQEGKYFKPILLQPKSFESEAEKQAWIGKNKDNPEKLHTEYLNDGEPNIFYYPDAPMGEEVVTPEKKEAKGVAPFKGQKINNLNGLPYLPDQSTTPPDPIVPHIKIERNYERLDPAAITYEDNLKEINRNVDYGTNQLNNLPDSQRRAGLANIMASAQESTNQAITGINAQNAMNFQKVEQFNIGQNDREEDNRAIDTLNFEQRQLTGQAITLADVNSYFDFNRKVKLQNYNYLQDRNFMQSLFKVYKQDANGNLVLNEEAVEDLQVPYTYSPQTVKIVEQTNKKK